MFQAADHAVVRLAALPGTRADLTRVDLAPEQEGYEQRLADYLRDLTKDPLVHEAIEVSSASLAATLAKVHEGRPVDRAKLERAAFAATRYVLRMASRPTPFGLLAGVCPSSSGPDARFSWGADHVKGVRPDAEWLASVLTELRRRPSVRDAMRVVVNNLCLVRGPRLVLPYVRNGDRELSIGCSPAVSAVLRLARSPIAYDVLRGRLRDEFAGSADEVIDRMLGELVEREVLLTDVTAVLDEPDRLGHVLTRLAEVDDPAVAELRHVQRLLGDYARRPLGEGQDAWRRAVSAMGELASTDKAPIQVDLRVDADVVLPAEVLRETERVASVLWRLAPAVDGVSYLREYHAAFLERYGVDRTVSVLDLLDPHVGLGPPAGYQVPGGDRVAPDEPSYPVSRDEIVARLALLDEVVLDEELVDSLAHDGALSPTRSLDLCVQVFARSPEALTRGEFQLAVASAGGSVTAGAMSGRFTELLDGEERLRQLLGDRVQLVFQPAQARSENVVLAPVVSDRMVPIGTFADPDDDRVLDVRDLAVGATSERFYLVDRSTWHEVSVVAPHMLNLQKSAPNVARFVNAVAVSGTRPWTPWQWGRADVLPRLPRVRCGRTVLAPARWRPDPVLCEERTPWEVWLRALAQWRHHWSVPDLVRVSVFDHHVDLDLTVPLHQRLLRTQLIKRQSHIVYEVPDGELGWTGGHANEVVVSLLSQAERPEVTPADCTSNVVYHPGSEWLHAKLYLLADLQDSLLSREFARLVEHDCVDRWFFVRYRDPDAHLRLRLHGPADLLNAEVLPELRDWAVGAVERGAIRKFVLDSYEPEVQRYGGPGAMRAAEELFHADSLAVLEQLRLRDRGALPIPVEVLAAMNHADLLGSVGGADWMRWVVDAFPVELQNSFRTHRDVALRFVDPSLRWDELRQLDGGPALLDTWQRRAEAAAKWRALAGATDASSILHMHANRLLGADRQAEQRSFGVLRGVVRAYLGKLRHRG
ncbi:lantibiotic dehydratase [Kutzneria viridogrisea]|uniref:Thiopeptide-type bacteriocin biosynthesis protein n=1 Tax=Kutzneria viridogrisea TaxID=47990 RepID=A0ABR6BFQ6_9PSEU|nr:thiopeptide-type bacteriocin biosynthesis protein [Kutzneria viridogrisea]